MPEGSIIKAVKGGKVIRSGWQNPDNHNEGYGQRIKIQNDDGTFSDYGHMLEESIVKNDEYVKAGQDIGLVGNTGSSTGPHLHYNLRDSVGNIIKPSVQEIADILNNFARQEFDM